MMGQGTPEAPSAVDQPLFATTHWSVVLAAANQETPGTAAALEQLCRTYWYPMYAYVRHRGHKPEDSKDLTQEFFYQLLRRHFLAQVDPQKGKFRSFLLAAINHFLANEWDRARTVKRGGQITFMSLDENLAEQRYAGEQEAGRSPEQLFERAWALALLERVLGRLREEAVRTERATHFAELQIFLTGEKTPASYAALAAMLGTNESALRKEVQRLRQRYGELLREEIGRTVANTVEVEDELCHLFTVLSV